MIKKFFAASVAAIAMLTAAPALAGTLDVNLGAQGATQNLQGNSAQVAISAAAAVGHTGDYVDVNSTAVNATQLADVANDVTQGATYDVNAAVTGTRQLVNGNIRQVGVSIAGTGDLGAHSSISSTMANLGQSTSVDVKVHQ
jgi:Flp pilus assembly protein TadG